MFQEEPRRAVALRVEAEAVGLLEKILRTGAVAAFEGAQSSFVALCPLGEFGACRGSEEFIDAGGVHASFHTELAHAAGAKLTRDVLLHGLAKQDAGAEGFVQALDAAGEVHSISDERVVDVFGASDVSGDYFAVVQAHPGAQRLAPDLETCVFVQFPGGPDGFHGCMLIGKGHAPGGKDGIPDEFDHTAVVVENAVRGALKVAVEVLDNVHRLTHTLADVRKVLDVGEHHRCHRFVAAGIE